MLGCSFRESSVHPALQTLTLEVKSLVNLLTFLLMNMKLGQRKCRCSAVIGPFTSCKLTGERMGGGAASGWKACFWMEDVINKVEVKAFWNVSLLKETLHTMVSSPSVKHMTDVVVSLSSSSGSGCRCVQTLSRLP